MNIYLDTIGCRLNQSEIEKIGGQLRAAGHNLVASAAEADVVIINTCAVTRQAASDSRQKARQAYRADAGRIVLTGCWATIDVEDALALPGVTDVFLNEQKETIVSSLLGISEEAPLPETDIRHPLPGSHARTRAFIKVQDGCDNFCTFCITRIARGHSKSQTVSQVLSDIHAAEKGGVQEIVLTGVHLASWGRDFSSPLSLHELIETILQQTSIPRIRLSSLEPWDMDEQFFHLWENERLCRHLHLPLQSGAASTLKRMGRKNTPDSFAAICEQARRIQPDMAITTDVIVGFPGEDEDEFLESMNFIQSIRFSGGHVFSYSIRPGTPAARLDGQNTKQIKKARNSQLRKIFEDTSKQYRSAQIGRKVSVLWETSETIPGKVNTWLLSGLSDNYIRIEAMSNRPMHNTISQVLLQELTQEGMKGVISDLTP